MGLIDGDFLIEKAPLYVYYAQRGIRVVDQFALVRPALTDAPEPEVLVRSLGDGSVSHLRNWLDCIRSRKTPNAPMRVGHLAVRAAHIANAAWGLRTRVRFNEKTGKVETV